MKELTKFSILFILLSFSIYISTKRVDFKSENWESGLITISKEKGDIFYWLFKPRSENIEAPLAIWLNGGPGSSSMLGLFYENGPFKIEGKYPNQKLETRDISWNENLNILYVDQPRGVGFSKLIGNPCSEELCVADDMYIFIHKFFDLHTEYIYKPFYLTGESYAGHYLPAIARKLFDFPDPKINFMGIAIGNPCTDPIRQEGLYAYYLKLNGITNTPQYIFDKTRELLCQLLLKLKIPNDYLNLDICWDWTVHFPANLYNFNRYNIKTSINYDFSALNDYLNQSEIKKSLGIFDERKYIQTSDYIWNIFAYDFLQSQLFNVNYLLENGVNILIYVGMDDFLANYLGTEAWVAAMDWSKANLWDSVPELDWVVDDVKSGYSKKLLNLKLLKILNSGHLVPMDQPKIAFDMIMDFIFHNN